MTTTRFVSRALCASIALLSAPLAWSAGAEVPVIAISSQGTSNANSAEARDASVIFYNPAGMALLRGTQISQPFALIAASTKVKDTGTTRVQDLRQDPDTGNTANWVDIYGDGCNWYELNDSPGCVAFGNAYTGVMGPATENCCYCFDEQSTIKNIY